LEIEISDQRIIVEAYLLSRLAYMTRNVYVTRFTAGGRRLMSVIELFSPSA